MVDKILIEKITNGYLVKTDWYRIKEDMTTHHPDIDDALKHLKSCFVFEKESKKQIRAEAIQPAQEIKG